MNKSLFSKILPILTIIVLGLIVYYPSIQSGFMWDDEQQVVNHIYIRSIKNIPFFFQGSTFYHQQEHLIGAFYRPLMTTVYTLVYPFSDGQPFAFHVTQLLIHIVNSILVFFVLDHLLQFAPSKRIKATFLSTFLSLAFLIHPMNSEVVSYIANMQDVLFFLFGTLGLLGVIKIKSLKKSLLISAICLWLSIFSKETGILYFFLYLVYVFLFRKKELFKYLTALGAVVAIYITTRCTLAHMCQGHNGPNPIAKLPFLGYLTQLPAMLFYYIKTFFYPANVAIGQHWWVKSLNAYDFFLPLVGLIIFFGIMVFIWLFLSYKASEDPTYKETALTFSFFSIWLILGMTMHMHIMPLDFTVADRWFYFSMPGIIGIIAVLYLLLVKEIGLRIYAVSFLIILLLANITWQRNNLFQNTLSLYLHDKIIARESFDLENNIGVEYYRRKQYDKAREHFQQSVKELPAWPISLVNLGVTYEREENYKTAEKYYSKAIKGNTYYPGLVNYTRVLYKQKRYKEVNIFLKQKALPYYPHDAELLKYYKKTIQ